MGNAANEVWYTLGAPAHNLLRAVQILHMNEDKQKQRIRQLISTHPLVDDRSCQTQPARRPDQSPLLRSSWSPGLVARYPQDWGELSEA